MTETIQYAVLRGTVSQVVFQNAENGYAVLRVSAEDGDEVTVTGCVPNVGMGEFLHILGQWTTHPSYGEQFAGATFERSLPEHPSGIADYLSSGLIRGIGPKMAAKIADAFGEETFDVLAYDLARLMTVKGMTEKKAQAIQKQFIEHNDMRMLISFLTENHLPLPLMPLLYKRLGASAIDALTENPYLLCDSYYAVDFQIADGLALSLGLSPTSTERMDAGILYTLTFNLNNGHTFIPAEKLRAVACNLLLTEDSELTEEDMAAGIARLEEAGELVCEHICGREAVYLQPLYDAEDYLAHMLRKMAEHTYTYDFDIDALLKELESSSDVDFAPLQREAISMAVKHGLVILTGGPGTGKTTTVRGMLRAFEALGLNVQLAAPTGRAAKRLSELCGMEARTMHRLLEAGYGPGGKIVFQRCKTYPLECDVVILDEVSMVDIALMRSLIEALPWGARLVLVGDADQLPPVGPGNFLRDSIASQIIPTIRLSEIFRQAQKSDIVMNAHAINAGQSPQSSGKEGDFFILKQSEAEAVAKTVCDLCSERLPNYYGFSPSQIQVLSPSKQQGAGTRMLNRALQARLNPPSPHKAEKSFGDTTFREGDRVMQVRNNYDILWETSDGTDAGTGMFNGDVGEILQIMPNQECLVVKFDEKIATYTFDMLVELELAYAITVHKAQGSEFDAVVLALSAGIPKRLLTRNILYTAITRAKRLLVLVGNQDTTTYMVENNTKGKRYSALRARLTQEEA